ncbi:response regulator transcription factor [Catenulispora pinisilvae]|uniref:response regulator transcription factor n=1 Tax=Catenulispora pinisilvae TaxID=2705253 RepID=UPI002B264A6D|nr:response regulator transcription factor [Catenulispora pinisilvae]
MTHDERISILLVDDQPLTRVGFGLLLGAEPDMEVVGEASDGVEAIRQARRLRPRVVLMDVRMPVMDGVEATGAIVAAVPESRVLILTTFDLDEYAFDGLRAGASGFLLKNALPADLLSAIRTIAAGDAVVAPRVTRRLLETVAHRLPSSSGAVADSRLDRLTPRERDILIEVALGKSNTEIAADLFLSENTVKSHFKHVLAKLGLRDRVQAVIFAYENGLA